MEQEEEAVVKGQIHNIEVDRYGPNDTREREEDRMQTQSLGVRLLGLLRCYHELLD